MIVGVLLKALNCIHFSSWMDFICEFIPQIIFMFLIFGWMIAQIFIKWSFDWAYPGAPTPPSIITNMINMALAGGKILAESPLWGDQAAQETLQLNMFLIAVICIPIMLLPKPIILIWCIKKKGITCEEDVIQGIEMMKKDSSEKGLLDDYD